MAAKKSFTNPAMQFITAPEERAQQAEPEGLEIPKGYRLVKENKSARLQLLVRPGIKEELKRIADARGQSMNDLANEILQEYTERQGNK